VSKEWLGHLALSQQIPPNLACQFFMPAARRENLRSKIPPRQTPGAPRHFLVFAGTLLVALATHPLSASESTVTLVTAPQQTTARPLSPAEPVAAAPVKKPENSNKTNLLPTFSPFVTPAIPGPFVMSPRISSATPAVPAPATVILPQKLGPKEADVEPALPSPTVELRTAPQRLIAAEGPIEAEPTNVVAFETLPPTERTNVLIGEPVPAPNATQPNPATIFGLRPMSSLSTNISIPPTKDEESLPEDAALRRFEEEGLIAHAGDVGRDWALTDYRWEASCLCHGPVLFEQLNAERYGITYGCLQPIVSGAHFFVTVPALPYKVWAQGHDHCQYALGYYRPGSYATPQCYKPRISADASLFEAGVILGLIYILP
jgi:hypothetical protein